MRTMEENSSRRVGSSSATTPDPQLVSGQQTYSRSRTSYDTQSRETGVRNPPTEYVQYSSTPFTSSTTVSTSRPPPSSSFSGARPATTTTVEMSVGERSMGGGSRLTSPQPSLVSPSPSRVADESLRTPSHMKTPNETVFLTQTQHSEVNPTESRRTAESIRRHREEISASNGNSPPTSTTRVTSTKVTEVMTPAGLNTSTRQQQQQRQPPLLSTSSSSSTRSNNIASAGMDGRTTTTTTTFNTRTQTTPSSSATTSARHVQKDRAEAAISASRDDLARKWLDAANGVLNKPTAQQQFTRLSNEMAKTPGGGATGTPVATATSGSVATMAGRRPPNESASSTFQSSSRKQRDYDDQNEKQMDEEDEHKRNNYDEFGGQQQQKKKNERSIFSEDEEDEEVSFAERKAERFLSIASTVLSEDKIIAQDPRALLTNNCRVFLRSFRGTFLRRNPQEITSRAMTGGSPFDVECCEFTIEKVSTSPSKVIFFGDRVFIKDGRGWFLSGGDFTRDARSTWTIRRYVDHPDFSRPERTYLCASDAVIFEYDSNKRILGVPSTPHDSEGSSYVTLEVSPLEESQKWFVLRSQGPATTFMSQSQRGDATLISNLSSIGTNSMISMLENEDDDPTEHVSDRMVIVEEPGNTISVKKRPVSSPRYVLDVCLGLYLPSPRLENQIKASEDLLLIDRLRPLFDSLFFLRQYTLSRSQLDWGKICHALCFYLQEKVLDPFDDFLAQFNGRETLTFLFSAIQPRARLILDWARALQACAHARGGTLLNALHSSRVGNFESRNVCDEAIEFAVQPYLEMLWLWETKGKVDDPFGEFLIVDHPNLTPDEMSKSFNSRFWTSKFTLREEKVIPWFLRAYVELVLKTGRNAFAAAHSLQDDKDEDAKIKQEMTALLHSKRLKDLLLGDTLQRLHRSSSTLLLNVLHRNQLMNKLRFLKQYFLLENMDFFLHFMDVAGEDLRGPVRRGSAARLRVLLQVAMRELGGEFVDSLTCALLPFAIDYHVERIHNEGVPSTVVDTEGGLEDTLVAPPPPSAFVRSSASMNDEFATPGYNLRCVDAFVLDMVSEWPLSLVLSKRTMTKYQLLFRHLFRCKHAERRVGMSWAEAVVRKDGRANDMVAQSLILRMHQFLQSLEYYTTFEVIEPRWRDFMARAENVKDIDELLRAHEDMLDSCLRECLLTNSTLIRGLSRLLRLCLSLGDLLLDHGADEDDSIAIQCDQIRVTEFDQELASFLVSLKDEADKGQIRTEHLYNLAVRLDFSDFYGIMTEVEK